MTYETHAPAVAKEKLNELVDRFRSKIHQYQSQNYNEENTRADFIDKFFALLGWDMDNTAGGGERYREVVREKSVKIDGQRKAPDYTFRIGEKEMFFVEAKKPSVIIKTDASSAFQLRQYGFSRELPLSILTNFSEFAVYKTRVKIDETDTASTARIFYCRYDEFFNRCNVFPKYQTNFDYIDGIFSRQNVYGEKFDDFAKSDAIRRGTSPVDKELLAVVEKWRETLAINIAKRNPTLDIHRLNAAVQKIIDRILFLRIAEGRGIERHENLFKTISEPGIYTRLQEVFTVANRKYNAGLFERSDWLDTIAVDDKALAPIIKGLYGEKCPYAFEAIPIEILGSIYERFLGKTILLTTSHRVKVEDKPEVRKAGGVYYTPQYIVDYIVRQTLGRKIDTAKPIPPLTILDPACGSGSFLIGAYSYLLDVHLSYYTHDTPTLKKSLKNEKIYPVGENDYRLSIEEKRRILLENIYGVDTDELAVEVTKLSLYLKLMENETEESCENLFRYSDLKALPNLDKNIQCGNSLIEDNFYDGRLSLLEDDKMTQKVNTFDWQRKFPTIFSAGGFDIVVGNPPYVRPHHIEPVFKEYFWQQYRTFVAKSDLYAVFMEKVLHLLKDNGMFGYIVSSTYFGLESFTNLRKILLGNTIHNLTVPKSRVFQDSIVETSVIIASKQKPTLESKIRVNSLDQDCEHFITQSSFHKNHNCIFDISSGFKPDMSKFAILDDVVTFYYGLKTADDEKFLSRKQKNKQYKPLLTRSDFGRYVTKFDNYYVWYRPELMKENKTTSRPGEPFRFENDKIIVMDIAKKIVAQLDTQNFYVKDALIFHSKDDNISLKFILGILNSTLLTYLYSNSFLGIAVAKNAILQLPFPRLDFSNKSDKKRYDTIIELVDKMLTIQANFRESASELDRRRISIIDEQIDKAVYQLYGLTDEEIRIVEGV